MHRQGVDIRCIKGEVEALRQLEVQLDGGTLVRALQGVLNDNVNLCAAKEDIWA